MLDSRNKFDILAKVIKISNSTILLGRRSHFIIKFISDALHTDKTALFILDKEIRTLTLKAISEDSSEFDSSYTISKDDPHY